MKKIKHHHHSFFCPFCKTSRVITIGRHLTSLNYLQIFFLTFFTTAIFYGSMGLKSLFCFFVYWVGFEGVRRLLYKAQLPCPHCGFDPTWYKRNVNIAKRKIQEFATPKIKI